MGLGSGDSPITGERVFEEKDSIFKGTSEYEFPFRKNFYEIKTTTTKCLSPLRQCLYVALVAFLRRRSLREFLASAAFEEASPDLRVFRAYRLKSKER